ncbi:hypothetical protein BDN70DRAFT_938228 [Pholiota conissans]|uniref:Uncharacterized protein n=1 Tax=Pholiota conissans TaxID=109636 RepID=A0A9P5YM80_9AGAR|nr:hypothetical protein BDN70DRAFT_938228 [Pholiota conissans]
MAVRIKVSVEKDLQSNTTSTRWTCKHPDKSGLDRQRQYFVLDLKIRFGTYFIDWNGSDCRLLTDRFGLVFGALAGMPNGWQGVHDAAARAMRIARVLLWDVAAKYQSHRRGHYLALSCGISHGGGQVRPSNLRWSKAVAKVLSFLLQDAAFQRISGFADCILRAYAPRLHQYSSSVLDSLEKRDSNLERPFPDSAFAACCFNLGPQTVSYPHRDHANLAWGWCAITALGKFDHTKGGHLMIWDLNCAAPLRPGATIVIPSALLEHSNAAILANEERFSFVQFSAGGLFRWAENGFQSEAAWRSKATKEALRLRDADLRLRWSRGLSMLSKIDEFAPPKTK